MFRKLAYGLSATFAATLLVITAVCLVPASHANDARQDIYSKVIDVASLATGSGETDTVTVPSAVLGDACDVSSSVDLQGIVATCYVSAAKTVSVRFQNQTGGTLDLASATVRVFLIPHGTR